MWRRHERGQVRVGRGHNGTGEVSSYLTLTSHLLTLLHSYSLTNLLLHHQHFNNFSVLVIVLDKF